MVRPNGLGLSGGAPRDRERYRADSSLQKSPDLAGAKRRPLHPVITVGVTPHQRNPLARFIPYTCLRDQQQATVKGTGATEPMLHPGSHASVTPSLVAGAALAVPDPDQDATSIRCGGWSLCLRTCS